VRRAAQGNADKPHWASTVFTRRARPKGEDFQAAIGLLGSDVDGAHDVIDGAVSRTAEFSRVALDGGNDPVGDVLVNVEGSPFMVVPLVGRVTGP
jgi:hypothetical protein